MTDANRDKGPAILVVSFDRAQDLWNPFFTLFFRFWPDCPFPIYLETNFLEYPDHRVTSLKLGEDLGFSDLLGKALDAIPNDDVLIFIDDFLLTQPVDTDGVIALHQLMAERQAVYFRLFPVPGADRVLGTIDGYEFGDIREGHRYRTALQLAFFNRRMLRSLIVQPEDPRTFELRSAERTIGMKEEFLSITKSSTRRPIHYFCTGVIHGRWVKGAVDLCRSHGIEIDLTKRPLQPWLHRFAHGNRFAGFLKRTYRNFDRWRRGVKS